MLDIVETLRRSPTVKQVEVIDIIDNITVKYLKCRAEFIDGSTLHISEGLISGKNKYSYHRQDDQNRLVVRWDNTPHHPNLATFPHHRHEGGTTHENPRVSISEILTAIETRLK